MSNYKNKNHQNFYISKNKLFHIYLPKNSSTFIIMPKFFTIY
jgi:hypothetical protein